MGRDCGEMRTDRAKRPTLLLAEDHAAAATKFVQILRDDFEVVGVVADGEALIEQANRLQPDAIVSDVSLKGLDGISATIEIRRRHPTVPIVLVTASPDPSLRSTALAAGAS